MHDYNWSGILFEADEARASTLRNLYKDRPDIQTCSTLVQNEGRSSLSNLLQELKAPSDFDFISIDVDGAGIFECISLLCMKNYLNFLI